jgi:hypothetical protein
MLPMSRHQLLVRAQQLPTRTRHSISNQTMQPLINSSTRKPSLRRLVKMTSSGGRSIPQQIHASTIIMAKAPPSQRSFVCRVKPIHLLSLCWSRTRSSMAQLLRLPLLLESLFRPRFPERHQKLAQLQKHPSKASLEFLPKRNSLVLSR